MSARTPRRAPLLGLALLTWAPASLSHDLELDHLTLWVEPNRSTLRGELTVRPDLTRDRRAPVTAQTKAQLGELVTRLKIRIDDRACDPTLNVRELWTRGGAVSGDVVMLSCPLAATARQIDVAIEAPFDVLAVTLEYRGLAATPAFSALLRAGDRTSAVPLRAAEPRDGWRPGGAELLVPPSAAPSSPATGPAPGRAMPASSAAPTPPVAPDPSSRPAAWSVVGSYCRLGIEHILPLGLDHVAFVVGIVLGATRRRELVLDISLFTLAHSLTLGLGASGWLAFSAAAVEPWIALSIAAIGLESWRAQRSRSHVPETRTSAVFRRSVVFAFGLLHGLGFANVLRELAVPPEAFVPALFGFNVGVELAQLVVAAALLVLLSVAGRTHRIRSAVTVGISVALVVLGLGWTGVRLAGG
jgi:hypothetical protein